jgi:hypothetical protein
MADWAVVTGAGGRHVELLDLVRGHNQRYAETLGMDYIESNHITRSWDKVGVLIDRLDAYEGVVWIDADAIVVGDEDIRLHLKDGAWGWVIHDCEGEGVPNCGVLVLRRQARVLLKEILRLREKYENHPWWEQAAAMEVTGWRPDVGASRYIGGSIFRTVELPYRFNVFRHYRETEHPVIIHASGIAWPHRIDYLEQALRGEYGSA